MYVNINLKHVIKAKQLSTMPGLQTSCRSETDLQKMDHNASKDNKRTQLVARPLHPADHRILP